MIKLTDLGNLRVGDSEIIIKTPEGEWSWRGKTYSDLPDLLWKVLKSIYPRNHEALEMAKEIFPGRFKCTQCGECCRHISSILPDFDIGGGVCCHLGEDGRCDIYESRPMICRVEDFWARCLRGKISKKDWYSLNYKSCRALQNPPGREGQN